MKFLYRFSLFFLIACAFFSIGLFAKDILNETVLKDKTPKAGYRNYTAEEPSQETMYKEAASVEKLVTSDTVYIVESYDMDTKKTEQKEEKIPPKLLGLTRERLEEEVAVYSNSPSLTDLEKGFISEELISFSPEKIIVRKNYQVIEEEAVPDFFYLVVENNYVLVYESDLTTVYLQTDILIEDLPAEVQDEIINMKYIGSEVELYNFLESYSS